MEGDNLLRLVRPVVAKIDGLGNIGRVEGGFGGFLGLDASSLENTSVFDHLTPFEGQRLAKYFVQKADQAIDSMAVPMSFRIDLLGADGKPHPVDVIPTPYEEDGVARGWVVLAIPVATTTAVSTALEAEMAGASRHRVRQLLTQELASERTGWFLLDLPEGGPVTVTGSHDRLDKLAEQLRSDVEAGWVPWEGITETVAAPLDIELAPPETRVALDAHAFTRLVAAPVIAGGKVIATYLHVAPTSCYIHADSIMINVMDRIKKLVDVTSLVLTRWSDQDELTTLAMCDTLTGLANRQAFSAALAERGNDSALIYIDVDSFKRVNDTLGHDAGDKVLCEVAERIVAACRPSDVVARLGGDEFAVLLDQVDLDTAQTIGQRIVESVREPMSVEGCGPVTVSAGLAKLDDDVDPIDDADHAMLRAKRTGRDQLVIA